MNFMEYRKIYNNKMATSPHTFNALQNLIVAMEAAHNCAGKKTFFGADKGEQAYAKFKVKLQATIHCLILDSEMNEAFASIDVHQLLVEQIADFSTAYPNWPKAYAFANEFFQNKPQAVAVIDRIR